MIKGRLVLSACAGAALLLAAGRARAQDENGDQSAVGAQVSSDTASGSAAATTKTPPSAASIVNAAMAGAAGAAGGSGLSARIMTNAAVVAAQIDSTGGYRFDGRNDCYGFVRRVWNPVLAGMKMSALPVNTYPDKRWAKVTSWALLFPGDVLATAQGHFWGGTWHGGLFAGNAKSGPQVFDDTPQWAAKPHPLSWEAGVFKYYYLPTHQLLQQPK